MISLKQRLQTAFRLQRAVRLVWQCAPGWTLLNLLLIVVQGILPLAALYLMKEIVDSVLVAVDSADPQGAFGTVLWWTLLAGGVALFSALCNALSGLVGEAQGTAVTDHVADLIHAKSIAVDLDYYDNPAFHDTLHRAQSEAPYRPARIVNGLVQTVQNAITLTGIVWLLFTFNWMTGLILLAAAMPAGIVRLVYARRLFGFEQRHAERERHAWYYHWLITGREFAKEVRLFHAGGVFSTRYRELRADLRDGRLLIARHRSMSDALIQGLASLAVFGALLFMAYQAVSGVITLGVLVMYFQGFQRAMTFLQNLLRGLAGLYEDNLFLTNFYCFLDFEPSIQTLQKPVALPSFSGEGLLFKNVSFTYPRAVRQTLHEVDFQLRPGEVVALVGENGAGKSTLIKLLCRLYDPEQGMVTVDGVDLKKLDLVAWQRQISVVFQDYIHYDLSVRDNIWLGDVEAGSGDEQVAEAARLAGIDKVLARLPGGYDAQLGTQFLGGRELSIGEWQKLALARAFFRNAKIVVLDEPSSALDPLAESELIERFRRIIAGRSAIIISHRLSTVRMADRIFVMAHGRIIETGSHTELLARDGLYSRLFRAQAEHYQT
jgi:ATP-binding cassette subfamily B protein